MAADQLLTQRWLSDIWLKQILDRYIEDSSFRSRAKSLYVESGFTDCKRHDAWIAVSYDLNRCCSYLHIIAAQRVTVGALTRSIYDPDERTWSSTVKSGDLSLHRSSFVKLSHLTVRITVLQCRRSERKLRNHNASSLRPHFPGQIYRDCKHARLITGWHSLSLCQGFCNPNPFH